MQKASTKARRNEKVNEKPLLQKRAVAFSANSNSNAIYYPDVFKNKRDRSLPDAGVHPSVTNTWILFVRQRKTSFISEDIKKFRCISSIGFDTWFKAILSILIKFVKNL